LVLRVFLEDPLKTTARLLLLLLSLAAWHQAAAAAPTNEQMQVEVSNLQLAAAARPRYSVIARFLERAIENPDSNYTLLQNTTILLPSNQALIDTLLRAWDNGTEWLRTVSYNIINGLYTLRGLRQLPRNAQIPTLLEGANLTKFNPSFSVALGQPGTKLYTWAVVKIPNLYNGVFLKAHGVDRWVVPPVA
ncbi:hypothetical protein CLOM_g14795, partial [Closterium sp. NIES-68]